MQRNHHLHRAARRQGPARCSTPGCGLPISDVAFWTERARVEASRYWLDEFVAAGHPASPEGLCSGCGGEWLNGLKAFRDANRCGGYCSPYDRCPCILMLPESEY